MAKATAFLLAGLALCGQARAAIDLYWRTQADFQTGSCNGVDPAYQPGSLVLAPAGGLPQDSFLTASPTSQWQLQNASYGLESLGRLRLFGHGSNPFMGLRSGSINGSQDFALRVTATCGALERSSIGLGFANAGGLLGLQVRVIRTTGNPRVSMLLLNGSITQEIFGQAIADSRVELGLSKNGNLVTGTMRSPVGQGMWGILGSATVSASTYSLYLGAGNNIELSGYPILNGSVSDLSSRPFVSKGTWTSPVLDLGCIPSTSGQLSWEQSLPSGTSVEIRTSASSDGVAWEALSNPLASSNCSRLLSSAKRFLRISVTLKSDPLAQNSPKVGAIALHYADVVPPNIDIYSDTHPKDEWSNRSAAHILWRLPPLAADLTGSYNWQLIALGQLIQTGTGPLAFWSNPAAQTISVSLPSDALYHLRIKAQSDPPSAYYGHPVPTPCIYDSSYDFIYDGTPPSAVSVSSTTHAPLLAARNASPRFKLSAADAASGLSGYAAVLDRQQLSDPGALVNAASELGWDNLASGTWYLHARAIDRAGNLGPVAHYGLIVALGGSLLGAGNVRVYPNPLRGHGGKFSYELAEPAADVMLEWRDAQGRLLMSRAGDCAMGPHLVAWDPGSWANGVYLIRVKAKGQDGKSWETVKKVALLR